MGTVHTVRDRFSPSGFAMTLARDSIQSCGDTDGANALVVGGWTYWVR